MTKRPSGSESAVREKPVPTWRAVTLAFATEAPSGSVILPAILPRPLRMRRNRNEEECEKNKQDMLLHFCLPFRGVPETKVRACPTNDHRVRQSSTKWPR